MDEIMDNDDEHISARQKNQTPCVAAVKNPITGQTSGTVYSKMSICIPIEAFEYEPSKWSDLKHSYTEDGMKHAARFRAITFVMQALRNEKIGTNYATGPGVMFDCNGRKMQKVIPKVEVLVRKLYREGPYFQPPKTLSPKEREQLELSTVELLDMSNIAGLRIFWFVQDPKFSFDEAFQEQIYSNHKHWKTMGFIPKNKDEDDDDENGGDFGVQYGDWRQKAGPMDSFVTHGDGGRGGGGKKRGRGGRGGRGRGRFNNDGKQNFMPDNKTTNDIVFTPENYKHLYASIMEPSEFAAEVVYPLTENTDLFDKFAETLGNDFNLNRAPPDHPLRAANWASFDSTTEVMTKETTDGWEHSACLAQTTASNYVAENEKTGEIEYTFPCKRLVWEYDPQSFVFKDLKRESLPFVVNSMFDMEARRILRRLEDKEEDNEKRKKLEREMDVDVDVQKELEELQLEEDRKALKAHPELEHMLKSLEEHRVKLLGEEKERLDKPLERLTPNLLRRSHLRNADRGKTEAATLYEIGGEQRVQFEIMAPKRKLLEKIRMIAPEEYQRMQVLLRREGMRRFMKLFNVDADISEPLKAMIQWYQKLRANGKKSLCMEINSVDPRKGRKINSMAWQYGMSETVDLLSGQHQIFSEIMESVLGATRYFRVAEEHGQTSLMASVILIAGAGAGKSLMGKLLMQKLIPGTVSCEDSSSQLAAYGKYDVDSFYIHDELRAYMASKYDKVDSRGQQSINLTKTMMTSHEITHRYLDFIKEPGKPSKRVTVTMTRENNSSSLQSSNHRDTDSEKALWNRFRVHNVGIPQNKYRPVFSLIMAKTGVEDLTSKEGHAMWASTLQFLTTCVHKMNVTGALPVCNVELFHILYDAVMRELTRYDPGIIKQIRSAEKPLARAYITCVTDAIDRHFFSEDSPFRVHDPVTGAAVGKVPFKFSHLQQLAPILVLREDSAIKLVTEYMDEQFPLVEHEVVSWIARSKCHYIPVVKAWIPTTETEEVVGNKRMKLHKDRYGNLYRNAGVHPDNTKYLTLDKDTDNALNRSVVNKGTIDRNFVVLKNTSLEMLAEQVAMEKTTGVSLEVNVIYNILKSLTHRTITFVEVGGRVRSTHVPPQASSSTGRTEMDPSKPGGPRNSENETCVTPEDGSAKGSTKMEHERIPRSVAVVEERVDPANPKIRSVIICTRFVERCPRTYEGVALRVMMHKYVRDYGTMRLPGDDTERNEVVWKMAAKELLREKLNHEEYESRKTEKRAKKTQAHPLSRRLNSDKPLNFLPPSVYSTSLGDGAVSSAPESAQTRARATEPQFETWDQNPSDEGAPMKLDKGKGRLDESATGTTQNKPDNKKRKWNQKDDELFAGCHFSDEEIQARVKLIRDRVLKPSERAIENYTNRETHHPRYVPIGRVDPECPYLVVTRQVVRTDYTIMIPNAVYVNKNMQYMLGNKNHQDDAESWKMSEYRKGKLRRYEYDIEREVWFKHLKSLGIPEADWASYLPEASDNRIAVLQKNPALHFSHISYPEDMILSKHAYEAEIDRIEATRIDGLEKEGEQLSNLRDYYMPNDQLVNPTPDTPVDPYFEPTPADGVAPGLERRKTLVLARSKGKYNTAPKVLAVPMPQSPVRNAPSSPARSGSQVTHPPHYFPPPSPKRMEALTKSLHGQTVDPLIAEVLTKQFKSKIKESKT